LYKHHAKQVYAGNGCKIQLFSTAIPKGRDKKINRYNIILGTKMIIINCKAPREFDFSEQYKLK